MHNQRIRRAIVLAAAGTLLAAAAVFADTIRADGDAVSPSIESFVELGEVTPGAVIHVDVAFQLDCAGTKHVDANQTLTLTLGSMTLPLGGKASGTPATVAPPGSNWPVDGTACPLIPLTPLRSSPNSHVTITAPMTLGAGRLYTLSYLRSLSPTSPNDTGTFSGSASNVTFSLDVVPNNPPVLTLPADMTVEGTETGGATVSFNVGATDVEDDPDPTPVCAPASGTFFALGQTTVSCTVTDSGKATATGTFVVNVVDTTAPSIAGLPADQSLITNDRDGATISYTLPSATDIVDPNPSVSCTPASGSLAPVGQTDVRCVATDASGNSTTRTFSVSVHLNAAPVLTYPSDMTVEGTATGGASVAYTADATDAEDNPDPTPVCSPASGSFFALGTTTVTCNVSDADGKTASGTFNVNVVDTTAPTIANVPANQGLVTNDPAGAAVIYQVPTATDVVDANPSVTCAPASGSVVPVGYSDVTCTATDASGNSSTATFGVAVHLNAGPVLGLPADMTVEGNATGGARVTYAVTATDAEDKPDPTAACSPASGSLFALGKTTVSCDVTDSGGKSASGSFTVTVVDTTAPTLSGGTTSLSLATTSTSGAVMSYTRPTATDVVNGNVGVSCSPASGSVAPVGDSFVNCTATDASGNAATSRIPVHVTFVSTDTWSATWEEPIGPPAAITANAGRNIPVKLRIYLNGVEVVTGTAFLRIVPCAGPPPTVETPLVYGLRWTGHIDTSTLTGDCYRVAVIAGGIEASSFRLNLVGGTPIKSPVKGGGKP